MMAAAGASSARGDMTFGLTAAAASVAAACGLVRVPPKPMLRYIVCSIMASHRTAPQTHPTKASRFLVCLRRSTSAARRRMRKLTPDQRSSRQPARRQRPQPRRSR